MIYNIIILFLLFLLILTFFLFCKNIIFNKKRYKCPREKIIPDNKVSGIPAKEEWYKKRNYCIQKCKNGCGILTMLKKIYWEKRKGEIE